MGKDKKDKNKPGNSALQSSIAGALGLKGSASQPATWATARNSPTLPRAVVEKRRDDNAQAHAETDFVLHQPEDWANQVALLQALRDRKLLDYVYTLGALSRNDLDEPLLEKLMHAGAEKNLPVAITDETWREVGFEELLKFLKSIAPHVWNAEKLVDDEAKAGARAKIAPLLLDYMKAHHMIAHDVTDAEILRDEDGFIPRIVEPLAKMFVLDKEHAQSHREAYQAYVKSDMTSKKGLPASLLADEESLLNDLDSMTLESGLGLAGPIDQIRGSLRHACDHYRHYIENCKAARSRQHNPAEAMLYKIEAMKYHQRAYEVMQATLQTLDEVCARVVTATNEMLFERTDLRDGLLDDLLGSLADMKRGYSEQVNSIGALKEKWKYWEGKHTKEMSQFEVRETTCAQAVMLLRDAVHVLYPMHCNMVDNVPLIERCETAFRAVTDAKKAGGKVTEEQWKAAYKSLRLIQTLLEPANGCLGSAALGVAHDEALPPELGDIYERTKKTAGEMHKVVEQRFAPVKEMIEAIDKNFDAVDRGQLHLENLHEQAQDLWKSIAPRQQQWNDYKQRRAQAAGAGAATAL